MLFCAVSFLQSACSAYFSGMLSTFREKRFTIQKNKKERLRSLQFLCVEKPPIFSAALHSGMIKDKKRERVSSRLLPCFRHCLDGEACTQSHRVRGSLTLETALVLPLFFLGLLSMISIMDLYRVETVHLTRLCQNAKRAAAFTYTPGGGGLTDLTIPDTYTFQPISGLIPVRAVRRTHLVRVRSWNGKTHEHHTESAASEKMVYVTQTGTVYHKDLGCSYLNLSVTHMSSAGLASARNSGGARYQPCELCVKSGIPDPLVYVTRQGDRYHNNPDCSGLKRSVRMVKESEVRGMRACSRCGQK